MKTDRTKEWQSNNTLRSTRSRKYDIQCNIEKFLRKNCKVVKLKTFLDDIRLFEDKQQYYVEDRGIGE